MSRIISVRCPNVRDCGHINVFSENELIGEVPCIDKQGNRLPPPENIKVDANTVVKCENCGYPISCAAAIFVEKEIDD